MLHDALAVASISGWRYSLWFVCELQSRSPILECSIALDSYNCLRTIRLLSSVPLCGVAKGVDIESLSFRTYTSLTTDREMNYCRCCMHRVLIHGLVDDSRSQ